MNIWKKRLLWLLVTFQAQRLLFLGFNFDAFAQVKTLTILGAFLEGIRYDACMIATVNGILIAFHSLRFANPLLGLSIRRWFIIWVDHATGLMFLFLNIPLIVFGVADSRLFAFTGRRVSPETFDIGGDILQQSTGILAQYWYITLPGLLLLGIFSKAVWQSDHAVAPIIWTKRRIFWFFNILVISALVIRGGIQTRPLSPTHAYQWQPASVANLVLNSSMTFLRSPPAKHITRYHDFSSMKDIFQLIGNPPRDLETLPIAAGRNFVVIIVESLATEYVGHFNNGVGYTPFVDELARQSIAFSDSFANGRRSIDAIPAVFAGIPAWREESFITSPYINNQIRSIPQILRPLGYRSLFFHGAANGSMHFDSFASLAGFDEYIGKNQYPYHGDDDGQWGIFDEPFLKYMAEKLTSVPEPFFAGVFTLSSHNPFKIPEHLANKFPGGTLPIHKSIGYADFALRQFFATASKMPWFHNTIFIITGDHTSLSDVPKYQNMPGRFRVPIIFHDPTGRLPKIQPNKVASHIDIPPTIFELVGAKVLENGCFGGPLFDRNWTGRFFQQEYNVWYYFNGATQVKMDEQNQFTFYRKEDVHWADPITPDQANDFESLKLEVKAARQYYFNGLLDNNWYVTP